MTHNKRSSQWFIKWVTASTISWLFAAMFGAVCRDLAWNNLNINTGLSMIITIIAVLVFASVSTSLTQWKILRSATDRIGHWGKASIKGWALGTLVGILILVLFVFLALVTIDILIPGSDEASSWARSLTFAIVVFPITAGLGWLGIVYFVSVFQAKILNQLVQQNSHWVRTSIISGFIGLFVVISAMIILRTRSSSIEVFSILGGIYGMIIGTITGTRLTSLPLLEFEKEEVANT